MPGLSSATGDAPSIQREENDIFINSNNTEMLTLIKMHLSLIAYFQARNCKIILSTFTESKNGQSIFDSEESCQLGRQNS